MHMARSKHKMKVAIIDKGVVNRDKATTSYVLWDSNKNIQALSTQVL